MSLLSAYRQGELACLLHVCLFALIQSNEFLPQSPKRYEAVMIMYFYLQKEHVMYIALMAHILHVLNILLKKALK